MKSSVNRWAVGVAILTLPATAAAQEVAITANVGWASDYLYRGIPQKTSSASAGMDLEVGVLSLGTWAADVGDGSEIDLYGSVGVDLGGLGLSVGGTGYFYTGDFDHTYLELNLGAAYGPIGVDYAVGQHQTAVKANYWFLGVSGEFRGAFATVGHFDYDKDASASGNFGQVGYAFSVADLDLSVSWVLSDADLALLGSGKGDQTLVVSIGKSFTLR